MAKKKTLIITGSIVLGILVVAMQLLFVFITAEPLTAMLPRQAALKERQLLHYVEYAGERYVNDLYMLYTTRQDDQVRGEVIEVHCDYLDTMLNMRLPANYRDYGIHLSFSAATGTTLSEIQGSKTGEDKHRTLGFNQRFSFYKWNRTRHAALWISRSLHPPETAAMPGNGRSK